MTELIVLIVVTWGGAVLWIWLAHRRHKAELNKLFEESTRYMRQHQKQQRFAAPPKTCA